VVLVALHWGWEYTTLPNPQQVALARRLTRSPDVDLVYGEHAHVVQPITRVNGKWVVYGLGNMIAQQETARPDTYEGISVRFRFRERPRGGFEVVEAAYVPTSWNVYGAGGPIRITRHVPADRLARIREAVHALGGTRGLDEL
jgi:poly-gamma-glutamate synthesis protein (capsule biosynthesis protein)